MKENAITEPLIGSAIEVHRELGPGLIEKAYEESLCHEMHITYLRLCDLRVGLIINFHVERLKDGITRVVNRFVDPDEPPAPADLRA